MWYCYERFVFLKNQGGNLTLADVAFTTDVNSYLSVSQTWLVFLVLLGITLALVLLAIIFLRNRIRIAIALIGQGSRYFVLITPRKDNQITIVKLLQSDWQHDVHTCFPPVPVDLSSNCPRIFPHFIRLLLLNRGVHL